MTLHSYDNSAEAGANQGILWNAVALAGRQTMVLGFSLALARMLGPTSFGIVAQATVYFALLTMILDQGLTASLISRKSVGAPELGAAAMLNLSLAAVFCLTTLALSSLVAEVFRTDELTAVLNVMAVGLFLKAAAIVPRMILMRRFDFKPIAVAEVASAFVAGVVAVVAAALGAGYWSIVIQLVGMDLVATVTLLVAARPPRPNFHWRELRSHFRFGVQVFGSNLLSFASRNTDNILVGRYLGPADLGHYSLAYRVLLTPIQMISLVVTRVLFPAVSKSRGDAAAVRTLLMKSTNGIAAIAFPLMGLLAVSAHDSVDLILGDDWLEAAPIIAVLAVTGARQSITATNAPVVLGLGRADIQLRFSLVAAVIQVGGIVMGLRWGALGVAWGYTIAGILLTPLILVIQRRLVGVGMSSQLMGLLPAFHCTMWAIGAYALVSLLLESSLTKLVVGLPLAVMVYFAMFWLVHRSVFTRTIRWFRAIVRDR